MPRDLLSIDDLSVADIGELLDRARQLEAGSAPLIGSSLVVGLCFLTPSLRTRVGFSVASARLGADHITVVEPRFMSGMSSPESVSDTVRTISGMVDLLILRTSDSIDEIARDLPCAVINAGDNREHPSQALIDLLAIETERGPVEQLTVALCGDLTGRSVHSLLRLLTRFPPKRLVLTSPPSRADHSVALASPLADRLVVRPELRLDDVDVLYMAGLPEGVGHNRLTSEQRAKYRIDITRLAQLPTDAVILSPMPVVDELGRAARRDPRLRMFHQSDRGVSVRVALIEVLLSGLHRPV